MALREQPIRFGTSADSAFPCGQIAAIAAIGGIIGGPVRSLNLERPRSALRVDMSARARRARRPAGLGAIWLGAVLAAGGPARAVPEDPTDPLHGEQAPAPEAELPPHIRVIPDAAVQEAGDRPALDLSMVYTRDIWVNVRGGLRQGWRSLDNLDAALAVDAERAVGWDGATLFLYGLYNSGRGFSRELVGDVQGASNIETEVDAARLYEAWIEQRFASGRASIKVGLFDLNSEFDVQDTGSLFVGSSHGIGPDFSQSGRNGPSIFPVTSLAARADYRLSDRWLVRAALLDGVPGDLQRPRRTVIELGGGDGALTVGEVEHRSGRLRAVAGYWRYTARFEALLATAIAGAPVERHGNDGIYFMADRKFSVTAEDPRGFSAWVRVGIADTDFNAIGAYLGGGLVFTGPLRERPTDQAGLAVGLARFGTPYRRSLETQGRGSDGSEVAFELTYRAALTDWLAIQPNLQYIADPSGDPALRDAILVGVRTQIGF